MSLKSFLSLHAWVAIILGIAFALEWLPMVALFAQPPITIEANPAHLMWMGASFTRMFGMLLFSMGLLIWPLRSLSSKADRQGVVTALFIGSMLTAMMALLQQMAIWNSLAGWLTVIFFLAMAGGYGYFFLSGVSQSETARAELDQVAAQDLQSLEQMKRIRYVTRNYEYMQGLKMLPMGLLFLAMGTGLLGKPGQLGLVIPGLILALVLSEVIGSYYRRYYGRVRPLKRDGGRTILVFLFGFVTLVIASVLDFTLKPPVNLTGMVLALLLGLLWWHQGARLRTHYLVMAILVMGISLLPLAGVSSGPEIIQMYGSTFNAMIGLIFIFGGFFDHRMLAKTMQHVQQEASHGRAV